MNSSHDAITLKSAKNLMDSIMTDHRMLYVICPHNIGDFLINGGFCHALQKKKRKQSCILISCDKFRNININFVGVSDIIYISKQGMNLIQQYIFATALYETDLYVYGHFHDSEHIPKGPDIPSSFVELYRQNVFCLPREEHLLPPIVDDITASRKQELHSLYHISKDTVVLMPHAYSVEKPPSANLWIQLCQNLLERGYHVYTNVAGSETVVEGTLPLRVTLPELFYLADKVRCFVALRSGITDFLAFTKAKIVCILEPMHWYFDLSRNYPDCNSQNYYYIGGYRKEIEAFMQQNNITDFHQLNFASEHVNNVDIYLEDAHLIQAILQDVDAEL